MAPGVGLGKAGIIVGALNLVGVVLLVAFILCLSRCSVQAHEWYPKECCADHDCHPVPCNSIRFKDGDYVYQGKYSYGQKMHFAKPMMKGMSPDGACHVCINSATTIPQPMCMWLEGDS